MTGGIPYRFNVINCEKPNSQFNFGMQPLLYSMKEATEGRPGWLRTASNITYYKNNFVYKVERDGQGEEDGRKKQKAFYTLTFSLSFSILVTSATWLTIILIHTLCFWYVLATCVHCGMFELCTYMYVLSVCYNH